MTETVRRWWWLTSRQRQGVAVVAGVYLLGWVLGRLSGKVEILERVNAAGPADP